MDLKQLEQLEDERNNFLLEIRACEALQDALEHIRRYNREKVWGKEVKVVNIHHILPNFEGITEDEVANEINRMYDQVMIISHRINQLEMEIKELAEKGIGQHGK